MTCILAFIEPKEGRVYMGGDRAATHTSGVYRVGSPKVFRRREFLFGCAGSFRQAQLLEHVFEPPTVTEEDAGDMDGFMVRRFVPALRACLKEGGVTQSDDGAETADQSSGILVAWRDHLWTLYFDYAVLRSDDGFAAIGSGMQYGLGALKALERHGRGDTTATALMLYALGISAEHSTGVSPPFDVLETYPAPRTPSCITFRP